MTMANLNIIAVPRRMLNATEAAQYCGLPVKKFPAICTVMPIELADKISRYDKRELDKWLDQLTQSNSTDDDILARLP